VPPLYTNRIRSRVLRWYSGLRDTEALMSDGVPVSGLLARMDTPDATVPQVPVPLAYTDELYALGCHIA
jgi:hypothetical protein